jgi:glucose-6-phosphate isomerase, archaeal
VSEIALPAVNMIHVARGVRSTATRVVERRLADMTHYYQDQDAVAVLLEKNPLIYRTYINHEPVDGRGFSVGTTVMKPGCVGDEFFMTKGHYHVNEEAPEVYLTLRGQGQLVMQTRSGEVEVQAMAPGSIHHIPGVWGHRTVNTGDEPLIFFAVWPADAGYDYAAFEQKGFRQLMIVGDDGPTIVTNPAYGRM